MTNEDAIKWLENLKQDIGQLRHENLWPYAQAIDEITELLKEHEPRVMTLEEAIEAVSKDGGIVWIEQKSHPLEVSHVLPTNHICDSPQRKFQDYGKEFVPKRYSYRYMWRCWTSWPTDEQRKTVKWE